MQRELRRTAELELDRNEKLLWLAQPDANILVKKALLGWTLLLTALFLESLSLIKHQTGDQSELLGTRVAAMILFALIGAGLLFFLPKISEATIFAITNKRVLKLVSNSFGHKLLMRKDAPTSETMKSVVHEKTSTEKTFWFNAGAYAFTFLMWATLFLPTMLANFDAYIASATALIVIVLVGFAINGKHKLNPTHRQASGTLYSIGKDLLYVEAIPLSDVTSVQSSAKSSGAGDVFVFSAKRGCLRMSATNDAAKAASILSRCNEADFETAVLPLPDSTLVVSKPEFENA